MLYFTSTNKSREAALVLYTFAGNWYYMPSISAMPLFIRYWPTVTGQQIKVNDRSALVDEAPRDLFYAPTQFDYLAHRL